MPTPATTNATIKELQTQNSAATTRTGIGFPKYFTARLEANKTPYDEVQWETRNATIGNDKPSQNNSRFVFCVGIIF